MPTLKQITIKKVHAQYQELQQLSKLLQSEQIKSNGKVTVKTDLECNILEIRKSVKELMGVNYSDITCVYLN